MPTSPDTKDRRTDRPTDTQTARALLDPPRWTRVERLQLIRREIREVLAPSSLEALFAYADRVVEGGADESGGTKPGAYATVMLTIDLERCAALFRDRSDAATAERLVELMTDHRWIKRRLVELARPELERWGKASVSARDVLVDMRVRAEGTRVFVDGDAMLRGAVASSRRSAAVVGIDRVARGGKR